MKTLEWLDRALTKTLEYLLSTLLALIAACVVGLVMLRYVFHSSVTGANETVTLLFIYTTAIGGAVCVGGGNHIAIRFAVDTLSPQHRVIARVAELIAVASLNALMVFYSIGWIQVTGSFLMPATGLPRWVAQLSVPIGCSLAVLYCLLQGCRLRLVHANNDGEVANLVEHPAGDIVSPDPSSDRRTHE